MNKRISTLQALLCATLSTLMPLPAAAQEADLDELRSLIVKNMGSEIYSGSQTFSLGSNIFLQIDKDDDGITAGDISLAESVLNAQLRASAVGQILRLDLDGDLKIEKREAIAYFSQFQNIRRDKFHGKGDKEALQRMDGEIARTFAGDKDKNGILEGQELSFYPEGESFAKAVGGSMRFGIEGAKVLLKLDPNGDGIASQSEALTLFGRALDGVDIFLEINKHRQPITENNKF